MIALAEHFPDAVLCFATLKHSLDQSEKELIGRVTDQSLSYEVDRRPFKPILILTNTELFSNDGPEITWNHAGAMYEDVASRYIGIRGLPEMCEETQRRYLS